MLLVKETRMHSSVVAENMKLLANSLCGYHFMDHSRHSVTRYIDDEATYAAINNKMLKRLVRINDQLDEVKLVKSGIERKEPIIVGFFILSSRRVSRPVGGGGVGDPIY